MEKKGILKLGKMIKTISQLEGGGVVDGQGEGYVVWKDEKIFRRI